MEMRVSELGRCRLLRLSAGALARKLPRRDHLCHHPRVVHICGAHRHNRRPSAISRRGSDSVFINRRTGLTRSQVRQQEVRPCLQCSACPSRVVLISIEAQDAARRSYHSRRRFAVIQSTTPCPGKEATVEIHLVSQLPRLPHHPQLTCVHATRDALFARLTPISMLLHVVSRGVGTPGRQC
jgi:hypothetical protein